MNPVQHAFCAECGGRLLPSSAEQPPSDAAPTIKGLSLPTKSPLSDEEEEAAEEAAEIDEETPAWLRELGARWPEGGAEVADSGESGEEIPDWLKDLRASLPDDQEEELPEEGEVPEWLAAMSLAASAAAPPEAQEPGGDRPAGDEEEAPDWLAEIRGTAGGEGDMPTESLGAELPGEELPGAEEEDVPDWLAEMHGAAGAEESGAEAPEPAGQEEEEAPDWLAELRGAAGAKEEEPGAGLPQETPDAEEGELPDWLAELHSAAGAEMEEPGAGPPREAPDIEEGEVPDWLAELRGAAGAETEELGAKPPGAELPEAEQLEKEGEEVPDWLAEMQVSAGGEWQEPGAGLPGAELLGAELTGAESPQETPDIEEGKVPDWLAELRGTAGAEAEEPEAEAPEPAGQEEEEVPDWLAEMRVSAGGEWQEPGADMPGAELPQQAPEIEEGEVPDWLAERQPHEAGAPEPAGAEEEEEIPDWLAEMRGAAAAVPGEPEMEEPSQAEQPEMAEAEVPDWLAELRPQEAGTPEPVGPAEQEEEKVPDWLAEMQISAGPEWEEAGEEKAADQVPGEISRADEAEEGETPGWLAELRGAAAEEEPEAVEPVPADEGEPIPVATMPGWLEELRPRGAAERPGAPELSEEGELPDWLVPAEGEMEETLARAEIPEWLLALKPAELREEGEPEGPAPLVEEPVEETGLLAGLQGTLPVEMIIAQPRAVAEVQEVEAPPTLDTPQARLFAEIVGRPPQAAPKEIVQPQRRLLAMLPRWLIYIALIAVVTLPLLSDQALLPRDLGAATPVQNLYDEIEQVPAGAPVLVAFDYDPGTSDEMDVVARVLVDHLMEQGAQIVAVSLYPAGPPLAQALLDDLAAGRSDYADAYGEMYTNLGYLPGQATAVRLMGQSLPVALPRDFQQNLLADQPIMEGIGGVGDFALILELAASEESLRWWVEQAATPHDVPLAGGVSASVAPLSRPYYQTGRQQMVGLVGGLPDAATYQALRGGEGVQDGTLAARLDALTGGHLVFILVLAIGSVVQLLRGSGGGR
jgi:hypothetical protein